MQAIIGGNRVVAISERDLALFVRSAEAKPNATMTINRFASSIGVTGAFLRKQELDWPLDQRGRIKVGAAIKLLRWYGYPVQHWIARLRADKLKGEYRKQKRAVHEINAKHRRTNGFDRMARGAASHSGGCIEALNP